MGISTFPAPSSGTSGIDIRVPANTVPTRTGSYGRVTATVAIPAGTYIAYQGGLASTQWTVNGVSVTAPTGQASVVSFTTTGTTFSIDYSPSSQLSWRNYATTWLVGSNTAIATNGSLYVAHNQITGSPWGFINYIVTSTDLINWTTRLNTGDTHNPRVVAYNSNVTGGYQWVATTGKRIYVSTNGTTWAQAVDTDSNDRIGSSKWGVAKGSNQAAKWVISGSGAQVFISTNGITWATRTMSANYSNPSVLSGGNEGSKYLAHFYGGYYSYSTDGLSWTDTSTPTYPFGSHWMGYANSTYIAMTLVGVYTSTDGITWTNIEPTSKVVYDIKYANSKYWGQDGSSNVVSSTDLITWNTEANITGLNSGNFVYDGSKFVAWTGNGAGFSKIYISTTGNGWTTGDTQITLVPVTSTPVTAS